MPASLLNTVPRTDLSAVLVRLSRECGVGLEHLRAEQLVREARHAWPGDEAEQWSRWIRETCECVALRSRVIELTIDDALHLSEDGALLVGGYQPETGVQVLLGFDGGSAEFASGEIDERVRVAQADLESHLGEATAGGELSTWVVVEHPELSDADEARDLHDQPIRRLWRIVRPEWPDIWLILVFAFFAGVLNLATPIAVEALVNTVAFGRLLQPVIILAALLFGFLAFAAVMQGMQTFVAEIIQRRLFTRVAADLAYRLPRVDATDMDGRYGPELVNRFLDVVTLQKVVAALLLDGVSIVLATLVGMTVLAFYHPWLLGFDVLLLGLVVFGLWGLGRGAVASGIDESKMKYRLTSWFEDVMRCQQGFKAEGGAEFVVDRANQLTADYLSARRSHFGILFRQIAFVLGLQAVAGTVLLGGGGWLVVHEQLSLGQLVAAELIVTTILASLAKLGKHLEGFYDAAAATDKLGALFDLRVERHDGVLTMTEPSGADDRGEQAGADVTVTDLKLPSSTVYAEIPAGKQVVVYGGRGQGKSALMRVLYGLEPAASGHAEIDGLDPRNVRPDVLRSRVALAGEPEVFEGTIADNVRIGRPGVSTTDARWALDQVGLLDDVLRLPNGLDTKLNASAAPLTTTQVRLLTLARAIAGRPRLLLVDGLLDSLPDVDLERVLAAVRGRESAWTLLVATGRRDVADRFDSVIELDAETFPRGAK